MNCEMKISRLTIFLSSLTVWQIFFSMQTKFSVENLVTHIHYKWWFLMIGYFHFRSVIINTKARRGQGQVGWKTQTKARREKKNKETSRNCTFLHQYSTDMSPLSQCSEGHLCHSTPETPWCAKKHCHASNSMRGWGSPPGPELNPLGTIVCCIKE